MRFHRFFILSSLLLTAAPLAAAPIAGPHPWCGTEEGYELIAEARHEEFQRRVARERREGRLLLKSAPAVYQEGQVAILDDDGTVTRPRQPFDLAGRSIEFLRRPQGMSAKRSRLDFEQLIGDKLPLGDDDAREVVFPEGFRFPFGDRTYRSVWVNSNGSLTFGEGELDFDAELPFPARRTVIAERFTSAPERLATATPTATRAASTSPVPTGATPWTPRAPWCTATTGATTATAPSRPPTARTRATARSTGI